MAEEAINQEVVQTPPESGNQDELESILDAIGEDDSVAESEPAAKAKEGEQEASSENKEDGVFKKAGNHVFKTEAEYDSWALKNYGEVNRLKGEANKKVELIEAEEKTVVDVQKLRQQIKVADFFEANPDAIEHKGVIAALLRSNKAKTLEEAKVMALRISGKEDKKEDHTEDIKNIAKSGGSEGSTSSYGSEESVKGTSDFADSALLGKV